MLPWPSEYLLTVVMTNDKRLNDNCNLDAHYSICVSKDTCEQSALAVSRHWHFRTVRHYSTDWVYSVTQTPPSWVEIKTQTPPWLRTAKKMKMSYNRYLQYLKLLDHQVLSHTCAKTKNKWNKQNRNTFIDKRTNCCWSESWLTGWMKWIMTRDEFPGIKV